MQDLLQPKITIEAKFSFKVHMYFYQGMLLILIEEYLLTMTNATKIFLDRSYKHMFLGVRFLPLLHHTDTVL